MQVDDIYVLPAIYALPALTQLRKELGAVPISESLAIRSLSMLEI